MFPGTRSVSPAVGRLLPLALAAVALLPAFVGVLVAVALLTAGPSVETAPAQDLLLGPFRWTPLAGRGLA